MSEPKKKRREVTEADKVIAKKLYDALCEMEAKLIDGIKRASESIQ